MAPPLGRNASTLVCMIGALRGGQLAWGGVLQSLGGEYTGFATLAHTQEDQCEHLLAHDHGDDYR